MDKLVDAFRELAEKFGSPVFDATMSAARMEGFSTLAGSFLWWGCAAALAVAGRRLGRDAREERYFFSWALLIIAAIVSLPGFWAWLDPWTWTAITRPEIWLAKRVFHL